MSIIDKAIEKLERSDRSGRKVKPAPVEYTPVKADFEPEPTERAAPAEEPAAKNKSTQRRATLDLDTLSKVGFVTPQSVDTQLAEQFRHIKRRILIKATEKRNGGPQNSNLVMVTSAVPAEGKTFFSLNLAMSIAMERDSTVLLIDADLSQPDLCPLLGIEPEMGLTELLCDPGLTLPDVLVKTNVPNLTVLPAGRPTSNMTELLASEAMRRLTEELAQRYSDRIVIFDSMPLLAKTSASVLAALVGQVVFVVEAVRTSQHAVQEALKLVDNPERIGLVLNKSRMRSPPPYGYGYHSDG